MLQSKAERREFLEERRRGVGGSDIAAILGHHPYKDALDVYLEKTRPVRPEDVEIEGQSVHLWRGVLLEPVIRDLFEHLYDRPVQRFGDGSNLKQHPDFPWVRAHLDGRQVSTGSHDWGTTGAWEAKAPSTHGFRRIVESGLERWRLMQIMWELHASQYEWGTVAIANLEDDRGPLISFDLEPHKTLIEQMHAKAEEFWFECVKPREKPGEEWLDAEEVEVPQMEGDRREIEDPEMVRATVRLMRAYLIRNKARDLYDERKEAYQELMEERGDVAIESPVGKINYRWRDGRTSFDREKLEKARPLDPDQVAEVFLSQPNVRPDKFDRDDLVDTLIEHAEMDLSAFETTGEPYRHFRPYPTVGDPSELPDPDNLQLGAGGEEQEGESD